MRRSTICSGRALAAARLASTTPASRRVCERPRTRAIRRAKLDLANCMAVGCDGHPADALTARAFGIDAARDGEPTAFLSMVRMPWGARLARTQMLAWQYFGDRLNEGGCMGDAYVPTTLAFGQTIALLERNADPKVLEEARKQAETLWSEHGVRAQKENGCE